MTAEQFRRLALSFPEAFESSHMKHPDFRVRGGKLFATLAYPDKKWGHGQADSGAAGRVCGRRAESICASDWRLGTRRGYQRPIAGGYEEGIAAGYGGGLVQCGAEEVGAGVRGSAEVNLCFGSVAED